LLNALHLRAFQSYYKSFIDSLLAGMQQHFAQHIRHEVSENNSTPVNPIDLTDPKSTAPPTALATILAGLDSLYANSGGTVRLEPKPRILVCAPSNAGVDEIISRVLGSAHYRPGATAGGFIDGYNKNYTPDIVRIGQSDTMREEIKAAIALDVLVEKYLKLTPEQLQARWKHANSAINQTSHDVHRMRHDFKLRYEKLIQQTILNYTAQRLNQAAGVQHPSVEIYSSALQLSELPSPREAVDQKFWVELARLHETKQNASTDAARCKIVLDAYGIVPSSGSGGVAPDQQQTTLNRRERAQAMDGLRLSYLNQAHIVFCTLSGAGLDLLSSLEQPFQALLIDEACQATELSTLVALRHNVAHCILIGDPKQLPATIFMQEDWQGRRFIERSLFERIQQSGHNNEALLQQYRMHTEIRKFPSQYFYNDQLIDGENITAQDSVYKAQQYYKHKLFGPFLFFDVRNDKFAPVNSALLKEFQALLDIKSFSRSYGNVVEAQFVCKLLQKLQQLFPEQYRLLSIGIITFYQQQKAILESILKLLGLGNIEVATVDGFQGREKDIIVVSCVRSVSSTANSSGRSIGFVADIRRLNVSLTRAKYALWICGDASVLSRGSREWRELVDNAKERQLFRNFNNVLHIDPSFLPYPPISANNFDDNNTINHLIKHNTTATNKEQTIQQSDRIIRLGFK
jgi:hypothetical protein